jgi:hypothetical protein
VRNLIPRGPVGQWSSDDVKIPFACKRTGRYLIGWSIEFLAAGGIRTRESAGPHAWPLEDGELSSTHAN